MHIHRHHNPHLDFLFAGHNTSCILFYLAVSRNFEIDGESALICASEHYKSTFMATTMCTFFRRAPRVRSRALRVVRQRRVVDEKPHLSFAAPDQAGDDGVFDGAGGENFVEHVFLPRTFGQNEDV